MKENKSMSSLYELTNDYVTVMSMLEDDEIEEQVILDTLESIGGEIEEKADNYAKIINSLNAKAKDISAEIDRLNQRKKTFENRSKWIKSCLEMSMNAIGKRKFSTTLFSFNIQKNGGKRALTIDADIDTIPDDFKIKQPDIINGDKVREHLKEIGHDYCEFAHLEPQGESLRIR